MTIEFDDEKMEEHMKIYNDPSLHEENSDFHTSHGVSGNVELNGGYKLLAGVKIETKLLYTKDTTRRITSDDITMKKTSVKIELGDEDVGDGEFNMFFLYF